MTQEAADALLRRVERDRRWPPATEREAISQVARLATFRESDEDALRQRADWDRDRQYVVDPIPERIATAKADLLFGEDPRVKAANKSDQGNLDRIIEGSDLPSELHWAEQIRSSEGEVWWRIGIIEGAPCPIPTFHSREVVVPLYVGAALLAVAFVSEFPEAETEDRESRVVWRHLEVQSLGRIENRLYRGTADSLGDGKELAAHPETADLTEVWDHGLDFICAGRVVNRRGRNRALGKSDYSGVEEIFLALNEAMTIGVENARLVAKKRAVVPASTVERRDPALPPDSIDDGEGGRIPVQSSNFPGGEDLLIAGGLDAELGKEEAASLFRVLEYTFDAKELVTWQDALVKVAASRCGLTVQFLGAGSAQGEGTAETGTALRVRLLPATSSSRGGGRSWDDAIPRILMLCQILDQAEFAHDYSSAGDPPAAERTDPLPRDLNEETTRHVAAVGGPVESTETAVRDLHPDWDDTQVEEEVDRIREDRKTSVTSLIGAGIPPGRTEEDEDPPEPEDGPGEGEAG